MPHWSIRRIALATIDYRIVPDCFLPDARLLAVRTGSAGIVLGDEPAPEGEIRACLKTVEGVRWTMRREERALDRVAAGGEIRDAVIVTGNGNRVDVRGKR